jgi:hypothetical protein
MNQRIKKRLADVVTPLLEPGERIEVLTRAGVGHVSVKRQLATAVAVAVASGGMATAIVQPKRQFVVVTTHRLMIFEPHWGSGRPTGKLLAEIPREAMAVARAKYFVTAKIDLAIEGAENGLRFVFPLVDRKEARAFHGALAAPVHGQYQI